MKDRQCLMRHSSVPVVPMSGFASRPEPGLPVVSVNGVRPGRSGNVDVPVDATLTRPGVPAEAKAVGDLASGFVTGAEYRDGKVYILHGETVLSTIDASPLVKDGMVSGVAVVGGNLVVTFNTDAGKSPISIPLVDIFDADAYYAKADVDAMVALTPVYSQTSFGEWTLSEEGRQFEIAWQPGFDRWALAGPTINECYCYEPHDAIRLEFNDGSDDFVATRSADIVGYTLGGHSDPVLAPRDNPNFFEVFSPDRVYAVGDRCFHNGRLFRKYRAVTGDSEFNLDDWEPTTVDAELRRLDSSLSSAVIQRVPVVEPVTWAQLKSRRDSGALVPGASYRITDYVATATGNTYALYQSGLPPVCATGVHQFDIIVDAVSASSLSEQARTPDGWCVWYCLDNDRDRFHWTAADGETGLFEGDAPFTGGRGVVYRLLDNRGNDIPFDYTGVKIGVVDVQDDGTGTFSWKWSIGTPGASGKLAACVRIGPFNGRSFDGIPHGGSGGSGGSDIPRVVLETGAYACTGIDIAPGCTDIRVGQGSSGVSIGPGCRGVNIGRHCQGVSVGPWCRDIGFGAGRGDATLFNSRAISSGTPAGEAGRLYYWQYQASAGMGLCVRDFASGEYRDLVGGRTGAAWYWPCFVPLPPVACVFCQPKSYVYDAVVGGGCHGILIDPSGTTSRATPYRGVTVAPGTGAGRALSYFTPTGAMKVITDGNVGQTFHTLYKPAGSQEVSV